MPPPQSQQAVSWQHQVDPGRFGRLWSSIYFGCPQPQSCEKHQTIQFANFHPASSSYLLPSRPSSMQKILCCSRMWCLPFGVPIAFGGLPVQNHWNVILFDNKCSRSNVCSNSTSAVALLCTLPLCTRALGRWVPRAQPPQHLWAIGSISNFKLE